MQKINTQMDTASGGESQTSVGLGMSPLVLHKLGIRASLVTEGALLSNSPPYSAGVSRCLKIQLPTRDSFLNVPLVAFSLSLSALPLSLNVPLPLPTELPGVSALLINYFKCSFARKKRDTTNKI